jgi:protein phosphatase
MIRVHALTDIGKVRDENQDSILILEPDKEHLRRHRGTLLVVADGMGGLEDGKVASQIAIDTLRATYFSGEGESCEALIESVQEASRAIFEYSIRTGEGQTMGSTCTAVAIMEHYACIAQVGDSRAYLYHRGQIRQITRDHSLVRELVDRGELDPRSIQYSFHRNVLTRGLGLCEDVEVDLFELSDLSDGDMLLLSSDGLHELIEEEELVAGIEEFGDRLDKLCCHFIDLANSRGGTDNISLGVALMGDFVECRGVEPAGDSDETETAPRESPQRFGCLVPLAIVASFCVGVLATLLLGTYSSASAHERTLERLHDLLRSVRSRETEPNEAVEALRRIVEDEDGR